ncbi:MAG: DUF3054 domain-containing protein [Halobacteriales archaeon]|nr:DUF3054 domain-containing protein [Halobacteriales archaeon]
MVRELFDGRLALSPTMALIALGDVLLIALFITIGELRHGVPPLSGLDTIGQFLIGWFIVAPFGRVYTFRAFDSPRAAGARLIAGWVPAAVLGVVIRANMEAGATIAPVFVLVTVIGGIVLLLPWRMAVAWYLDKRNNVLASGYRGSVL